MQACTETLSGQAEGKLPECDIVCLVSAVAFRLISCHKVHHLVSVCMAIDIGLPAGEVPRESDDR